MPAPSEGTITLADSIGCRYGNRVNQFEGYATKDDRVNKCRERTCVRLEGLANALNVQKVWSEEVKREEYATIRYEAYDDGSAVATRTFPSTK